MNKVIFLIGLVLISMFLFFGCTETSEITENQTLNTEVEPTLHFFYDPSWDLTIYNNFIENLNKQLPNIIIDKKCIDIQKYVQNISSASEEACISEIGYLKFNENMNLAKKLQLSSSVFVLNIKNKSVEIPFTPVTTAFAQKICLEDITIEGCDNLQELPKLEATVIIDVSKTEDYNNLFSFFESSGLPLEVNIINYLSEDAKTILNSHKLTTIPILIINQEAVEKITDEQIIILQQFILMGYFEQNTDILVLSLPGTEQFIGNKYNESKIDLFIMSYCPYGLQAQKAIIPVKKAFGDELTLNIKFVDYIMHGKIEIDENNIQYCLQKEYNEVFFDYLNCFTITGNTTDCLFKVNLTESNIQPCINELDKTYNLTMLYEDKNSWLNGRYPQYPINKLENEIYNVKGSPTMIFNGIPVSWPRSPEGIKQGICNMLENPPAVCNTNLSTATASPGIGGGTGTSSSGTC